MRVRALEEFVNLIKIELSRCEKLEMDSKSENILDEFYNPPPEFEIIGNFHPEYKEITFGLCIYFFACSFLRKERKLEQMKNLKIRGGRTYLS